MASGGRYARSDPERRVRGGRNLRWRGKGALLGTGRSRLGGGVSGTARPHDRVLQGVFRLLGEDARRLSNSRQCGRGHAFVCPQRSGRPPDAGRFWRPFFTRINGEVHHQPRYQRYPSLLAIGVVDRANTTEQRIFRTLVGRNAINLHAPAHDIAFVRRGESSDAMRATIIKAVVSMTVPRRSAA